MAALEDGFGKTKCRELYEAHVKSLEPEWQETPSVAPEAKPTAEEEAAFKQLEHVAFISATSLPTALKHMEAREQEDNGYEEHEGYVYNRPTDTYIVDGKKTKKRIIIKGSSVRAIVHGFTHGASESNLCITHSLTADALADVIKALDIKRTSSMSITPEEVKVKSVDELVDDIVKQKMMEVEDKSEKEIWKRTQGDALKWHEFQRDQFIPFSNILNTWNPPPYTPVKGPVSVATGRCLIIGAYDWHVGGLAEVEDLLMGRDWNIEEAKKSIIKYAAHLQKHSAEHHYDRAILVLGGDLFNSLTGVTSNNTQVGGDRLRETQYNAVSECLVYFIESVLNMFPKVEVHFVKGNHGGLYDYVLGAQLKAYFRTEKRLEFNNHQARHAFFMVRDVFCIAEHGARSDAKHLVPKDGTAREAYIQALILAKRKEFPDYKQCLFIMGDQHHTKYKDEGTHIFFQSGALPCGDKYAETMAKTSRPTQTCIAIDDDGISGFFQFYFD